MIVCVYHGSTFKDVNQEQTSKLTEVIKAAFPKQKVEEAYYSRHVLATMERRGTPLRSYSDVIEAATEPVYLLITNIIAGHEYQNIMELISRCNKQVYATKPLLDMSNINSVADALVDTKHPTLYVGHGSKSNDSYEKLDSLLSEEDNYVMTLGQEATEYLNERVIERTINVRPLMMTVAYHGVRDIQGKIGDQLLANGYKPQIILEPLCLNQKIQEVLVNNLASLIEQIEE